MEISFSRSLKNWIIASNPPVSISTEIDGNLPIHGLSHSVASTSKVGGYSGGGKPAVETYKVKRKNQLVTKKKGTPRQTSQGQKLDGR